MKYHQPNYEKEKNEEREGNKRGKKKTEREKRERACGRQGEGERDIYLIVNKGHPHFHFNTYPLYRLESSRN